LRAWRFEVNFDTPLVEYLIIGTHAMSWLTVLLMAFLKLPMSKLTELGPEAVFLVLPFAYLIGMLCDSTVQPLLERPRKHIKANYFGDEDKYKDELIALKSPDLHAAYDARVRRVRILGTAIFNWPLLAFSLLVYLGSMFSLQSLVIVAFGTLFTVLSVIAWRGLYRRAYRYRKNACDVIAWQDKIDSGTSLAKP
jgi:hypothetical protein